MVEKVELMKVMNIRQLFRLISQHCVVANSLFLSSCRLLGFSVALREEELSVINRNSHS